MLKGLTTFKRFTLTEQLYHKYSNSMRRVCNERGPHIFGMGFLALPPLDYIRCTLSLGLESPPAYVGSFLVPRSPKSAPFVMNWSCRHSLPMRPA